MDSKMQQEDFPFKKPVVKQRRPSLMCKETLSDLDEVWELPHARSTPGLQVGIGRKTTQTSPRRSLFGQPVPGSMETSVRNSTTPMPPKLLSPLQRMEDQFTKTKADRRIVGRGHGTLVMNNPDDEYLTDPMLDVVTQYERTIDSALSQRYHDDESAIAHDKYIRELHAEFNKSATSKTGHQMTRSVQQAREPNDWEVPDVSEMAESPGSPDSDFNMPIYQPFSSYTSTSSSFPDFLVMRDEAAQGGDSDSATSDLDWESLTPPVPGSPSDHTVPDLENPDMAIPSNDFLFNNFENQQRLRGLGGARGTGALALRNNYASSSGDPFMDQSVPDFLL